MKALNCKFKILLIALLLAGTGLYAQDAQKELHKEFKTNKSSVLIVDAKFTNLKINSWDKDKASFDVTVKVKNSDKDKAEKLLDQINVLFDQDGDQIIVETELDDDFSKSVQKVTQKFEIVIVASVPEYINLEMETKFGSTTMGSFSGNTEIENSFGAMEIEKLSGSEINIDVNQGDCTIGEVTNAVAEVNFGKLTIIKAGNIELDVNQGEAVLGMVTNLAGDVSMGNCVVKLVDPSFEKIDIEVNAGNVDLSVAQDAGFTIEAEMKMGNLDIPRRIGKTGKSDSGMYTSVEGTYGDGRSKIIVEGKLGNFELKLK